MWRELRQLQHCAMGTPGEPAEIEAISRSLSVPLPAEYVGLLASANGIVGRCGESYLQLWQVEQIAELNVAYDVASFAPGLVLIGSDGGDVAYGYVHRAGEPAFVAVPFIPMQTSEITVLGTTLEAFLDAAGSGA